MAELVLLTPEQLAERAQKPKGQGRVGRQRSPERTRIIEAYKAAMRDAAPGYGADVMLAEGEDKRQVRLNLKAAAEELNQALAFRPVKDQNRLHFRFITLEEQAARPKRGGRPRKQQGTAPVEGVDANGQAMEQDQAAETQPAATPAPKRRGRKPAPAAS